MDATTLIDHLQSAVPGATFEPLDGHDVPTALVAREHIVEACRALRDDAEWPFSLLSDVTCVDYWPRAPRYEVVYNLVCLGVAGFPRGDGGRPARVRLIVRLDGADARVPTVSSVYPAANWAEREVFDLFGIVFDGHPDLRRILMPDEWEGHPLRKDYPVQVKVPVRTHEALQLSEEEFVANMQRLRAPKSPR